MKKLSATYKELGIAFTFPIDIEDEKGNRTYYEDSNGFWTRREYDEDGNETYYETSGGYWSRSEYDKNGKETYYEDSDGDKRGTKRGSCDGKVIEVDGKKYKLMELWYNIDMSRYDTPHYAQLFRSEATDARARARKNGDEKKQLRDTITKIMKAFDGNEEVQEQILRVVHDQGHDGHLLKRLTNVMNG